MNVSFRLSVGLFLFALAITGCGGSPESSDLGGWTLDRESLTLTQDLLVSETENFFFGSIRGVDVAPDGRMIVGDSDANHLKVLRPNGTLIDSVGREGQGPGEFQFLGRTEVSAADSVYVHDLLAGGISVFGPGDPYSFERSVSPSNGERVGSVRILDDQFAVSFGAGFNPTSDEEPPPNAWRLMGPSGAVGDTLMMTRRRNVKMVESNGGFMIRAVPYGRQTIVRVGPDSRLYYGWTDSLRITARSPDGGAEVVASIPTTPVEVTSAERDSATADIDNGSMRSQITSAMPSTKPAFTDLVVADDGALWVERPVEGAATGTQTWWRLLPDSKTIQAVELPDEFQLQVVRDGKAYGVTQTDLGAPAIARYEIDSTG